jgi:uncharacterized membrane protein YbhN (UPF0104 family)
MIDLALIKVLVKIAVAAALMALIASRVDFSAAFALIAGARPALLGLTLLVSFCIVFADAAYWTHSMRAIGCRIDFRPAFLFSLVGWFFANLAPSTVGSDLFRAAQMRHAGAPVEKSVRLVVAARLMSFVSLLVVIALGLPVAARYINAPVEREALGGVFALALLGFGAFVFMGPRLKALMTGAGLHRLTFISALSADTRALLKTATPAAWVYLTAQHLLRVAGVAAVAAALNAPVDLIALYALIPAALLIAMIPISFGGWGVREASFVHFLGFAGVAPSAALAISIVYGLTRVLIGAIGGVVWILARRDHYRLDIDGSEAAGAPPAD